MEVKQAHKRTIQGKVVRRIDARSVVILVERKVVHQKYHKIVKRFKKYTIDDSQNKAEVGDFVSAIECKPVSKTKTFALKEIVLKGV
ncbi:SSU ribosomal protein S17p (S11e) [Helicobacter heilmannii]|uniref:Small ribosomal subunit protein uS17 n=1 Tax=Helicobacter heilmannii TaxID=35817 RepID=A0A0K2XUN7_HELHE|nr:30S ribosomal protein S17 [Helicobacter heilmannii]CCM12409.1 SSU ribosomal protein S17p (S11e) [Helicobacter heilmannii ASB1.4]CRF49802.1 SSU ribosomal protein S17p (S11e) [Helicobacter heilmannii]CRI34446.1 SSU ribosomal protein S17p (S11e) [Helicobacter heilmannii]BDQ26972.1 30S ribosomal protein S17 [Helicobacter heilmannii]GMB94868.1 30S ribosomal protein S17 [Helicobacter heilmannii]